MAGQDLAQGANIAKVTKNDSSINGKKPATDGDMVYMHN